jgi:hypothetical protein
MSQSTNAQIERWRQFLSEMQADPEWMTDHDETSRKRGVILPQMQALLTAYLEGRIHIEELRATWDSRTRRDWDLFGLKGMSGAMFLNQIVKFAPDKEAAAEHLKRVMALPVDASAARVALQAFHDFLADCIRVGRLTGRQLQLARTPYLVSAWWHIQDSEAWPVFYVSARDALEAEEMWKPTNDPVADYFAFCETLQTLRAALGLNAWTIESLCIRVAAGDRDTQAAAGEDAEVSLEPVIEDHASDAMTISHVQTQWLLAKIGRQCGCKVWIATNDQAKVWQGQRLGDLSMAAVPNLGMDSEAQRLISYIDVLWVKGANQVVAAFEIEHTTSIFSGLLRMSDLVVLSPNLNFPLYIVAPESRIGDVRRQLGRPTFQYLELHQRCGFFSAEELAREADNILKWANDPSVIRNLASHVETMQ